LTLGASKLDNHWTMTDAVSTNLLLT
jgi:hypothetical protein